MRVGCSGRWVLDSINFISRHHIFSRFYNLRNLLLLFQSEPPVQTLLEIVNSLVVISDLFTEVTQFAWLLESGFDLWKKYSKSDETVCAYLIVIICKAASVFVPLVSTDHHGTKSIPIRAEPTYVIIPPPIYLRRKWNQRRWSYEFWRSVSRITASVFKRLRYKVFCTCWSEFSNV